jgi:uncharacterized membrane protein
MRLKGTNFAAVAQWSATRSFLRAVKIVDFLQGKWLGHPLHPALVHVPVGGWIVACLIDGVRWMAGDSVALSRLALWCVGLGLLGALVAIAPGVADWSAVKKERPAWKLGLYHMILNLIAAMVWAVNFGLRLEAGHGGGGVSAPVLLTSAIGTVLVFAGAYLGSLLAFDQGVAIIRLSKKKWRAAAAAGGARLPEEK